ncbi:MAG: hypothetical protein ACQXXG_09010 [Candidatus Bathyarchaeia archaeon]|jgi:hypothetical protein
MTEAFKHCPFLNSCCITEKCACYIKVVKPFILSKKLGITDPQRFYAYKGCGLVKTIPWQIIEKKENGKLECLNK